MSLDVSKGTDRRVSSVYLIKVLVCEQFDMGVHCLIR